MKKVIIALFIILFCIFSWLSNKKDYKLIDVIAYDCINNSIYSEKACYNYAFTLIKTGEENLLHYSYNIQ